MFRQSRVPSVAVLATVLSVLLAGCVGGLVPAAGGQQAAGVDGTPSADLATSPNETTTIRASGVGRVTATPDEAVVSVTIEQLADNASDARSRVAADVDRVFAALADAGIPEDAVETAAFSLRPEYDYSRDGREFLGYRASHTLTVTVAPDRAGTVVDTAVDAGATRVDSVQFGLADDTRASLRAAALERATADARADADTVAGAAGLTVEAVRSLTVDGDSGPPVVFERFAADDGASTEFRPGEVTVTAQVSAVYTASETNSSS
jgi:uncharacterized protein YggE